MPISELEYDHTLFSEERQYAGDDKLYVRFYMDVIPDLEGSRVAGYRKFIDAEMIQIMVPGDKRNIINREVIDTDKQRFGKIYERFKAGEAEQQSGFPIREWPLITRAMAEEFKYLGFMTVEALANASDAHISKYPGMREVQSRAKTWLQAQKDAAPMEQLQNELGVRDEQIAAMKAQMDEMAKALAALKK